MQELARLVPPVESRQTVGQVHQVLHVAGLLAQRLPVMIDRRRQHLPPRQDSGEVVMRVGVIGPDRDRLLVGPDGRGVVPPLLAGRPEIEQDPDAFGRDPERRLEDRVVVTPVPQAHDAPGRERHDDERRHARRGDGGRGGAGRRQAIPAPRHGRSQRDADAGGGEVEETLGHDRADRDEKVGDRCERHSREGQREGRSGRAPPGPGDENSPGENARGAREGSEIERARGGRDGAERIIDRQARGPREEGDVAHQDRERGRFRLQERQLGDRIVDEMDGTRGIEPPKGGDAHGEERRQEGARNRVEPPGGPPPHDPQVRQEQEPWRDHRVLLRQETEGEQGQGNGREARADDSPASLSSGFAGVQEHEDGAEDEGRRQELCSPHDLPQDLRVHRVNGEQEGSEQRTGQRRAAPGSWPRKQPRRQEEDQKGVEGVQEQVDQAEPERPQAVHGPPDRERQDGHGPVQVRNLHLARAPVAAPEDLRDVPQVRGQSVLLDDPVIVVDEPGTESPQVHQNADGGNEEEVA